MDKKCSCCGVIKVLEDFVKDKYTSSGYKSNCKECGNRKSRERKPTVPKEIKTAQMKAWREKNKDYWNNYLKNKRGALENFQLKGRPEGISRKEARLKIKTNKSMKDKKNKSKRAIYLKEYFSNPENVLKRRQRVKDWLNNNPSAKLGQMLRHRLRTALKEQSASKYASFDKFLGCTVEEFKAHLESKWLPGMSWDNYGAWVNGEEPKWNIDHMHPCAAFDLTRIENQKICFHYSNMRPLWGNDNYAKGDKTIDCPWGYDFVI